MGGYMMSGTKKGIDFTPELFETALATFGTAEEKEAARRIVSCFIEHGFPVKVKQYNQPCMEGTCRVLCFIRNSAEAIIINNKGMGRDGVSIQVRIEDRSTLSKLDNLSENLRSQVLNSANCGHCSAKCGDKKYTFSYQDRNYVKCHFICSNFSFVNIGKSDIDSLMCIVESEIAYSQTRKK